MRYLKNIGKGLISISLMVYLVYNADPNRILAILSNISAARGVRYLGLAFGLSLISIFLMAVRWKVLLAGYKVRVGLQRLYGYYLIGLFFNNFLPTSIGGDVIRIYKVVEETNDRTVSFASVIIERMMGIAATLTLAVLALFSISQQFHSRRLLYVSLFLLIAITSFFLIIIRERSFKLLLTVFDKFTIFKIGEKFTKLFEAIHLFRSRRRILLYVFFFSVLSQIAIVMMNYFLARAFSLEIDLNYLFMVVPVTFLLTMLPSINGLGLRDLGFVSLLGRVGISDAAAISLSFMNVLLPMVISIWGAVLFVLQKRNTKTGGIDAIEKSF